MNGSKLVAILRKLSNKEQKKLGTYLTGSVDRQKSQVLALYAYIVEHIKKDKKALEKEVVFTHLYPNQIFKDAKVRYVMSDLV